MWELKVRRFEPGFQRYYYENESGEKIDYFGVAYPFKNGKALVLKMDEILYRFLNENGKLGEQTYTVGTLSERLLVLREWHRGRVGKAFVYNTQTGELSSGYDNIYTMFPNGLGFAENVNKGYQFFDENGKFDEDLESIQSDVACNFMDYLQDDKTVFDLKLECFGDERMLKEIQSREMGMIAQAYEHCDTEKEKLELKRLSETIGQYIKDQAYKAKSLGYTREKRPLPQTKDEVVSGMF